MGVYKHNKMSEFLDQEIVDLGDEIEKNVLFEEEEVRLRPSEEPETIRKWREEYVEILKDKDIKEQEMMEKLRENAKKELEDWYKHYNDGLEKTKEENRECEKEFVVTLNDIVPGTQWERINKLCDFNTKTSKNTKDLSRMRSILLQLKQNSSEKTN